MSSLEPDKFYLVENLYVFHLLKHFMVLGVIKNECLGLLFVMFGACESA